MPNIATPELNIYDYVNFAKLLSYYKAPFLVTKYDLHRSPLLEADPLIWSLNAHIAIIRHDCPNCRLNYPLKYISRCQRTQNSQGEI